MENINFEHQKGKGFVITDFPNAEKVIELRGEKAQNLADLALHRVDLIEAQEYLRLSVEAEDMSITEKVFWRMALINFTKCFGKNNARTNNLDITKVLDGDLEGQGIFLFFKDLRDKSIAHDDNPISQCMVGAIINKPNSTRKIEKITTMSVLGEMNADDNVKNLRALIEKSISYVNSRYDEICNEITNELELLSYEELYKIDAPTYTKPVDGDVHINRKKLK